MKDLQLEDNTVDFYSEELDLALGEAYMTLKPVKIADLLRTYATKTIKPITSYLTLAQSQALKDGRIYPDLGVEILSRKKYASIYYLTGINTKEVFADVGCFKNLDTFEQFIRAVVSCYRRHSQ